jgi:hypothetical protein
MNWSKFSHSTVAEKALISEIKAKEEEVNKQRLQTIKASEEELIAQQKLEDNRQMLNATIRQTHGLLGDFMHLTNVLHGNTGMQSPQMNRLVYECHTLDTLLRNPALLPIEHIQFSEYSLEEPM